MLRMNRSVYNNVAGVLMPCGVAPTTPNLGTFAMANYTQFDRLAAIPAGYGVGNSIAPPITGGAMSSYRKARISLSASGDGALGYGIFGNAVITLNASAVGGLVAGGVGAAVISLSASGSVTATIGATGSATISMSGTAEPGALGWLEGEATIMLSGDVISYAIGHMVGSTEDNSALTPNSIRDAVWAAVAAEHNDSGTMGARLNSAASGGVDLNALADAVWDHADAVAVSSKLALVEKILRNKTITDPDTGEFVLYDNDGTSELFRVPLWEDKAGTQPYRGQGGERRERLE